MDKQLQSILCVCLQHFLNQEIRFLHTCGFAIFVHILLEWLLVTLSRYARVDQGLGAVKVEGVSVENFVITIFLKIIGLSIDLLLNVQSILLLESHVEEPWTRPQVVFEEVFFVFQSYIVDDLPRELMILIIIKWFIFIHLCIILHFFNFIDDFQVEEFRSSIVEYDLCQDELLWIVPINVFVQKLIGF